MKRLIGLQIAIATLFASLAGAPPALAVDLDTGTSGTYLNNQSFDETRGADIFILGSANLSLTSMTLRSFAVGAASGTLGARVYQSATATLVASANIAVGSGSNQTATIPITATLTPGTAYRVCFYLNASGTGAAHLFDPSPAGAGGVPYDDASGTVRVNSLLSSAGDVFPTNINLGVPRISLALSPVCPPPCLEDLWVANGLVWTMARSDNVLYVGGDFTAIGPSVGAMAAIDKSTGVAQQPYTRLAGEVWAVAPDGAGGWFIGGSFATIQGQSRGSLAHFDASGLLTTWNPSANSTVRTLAVSGGTVYAGGDFTAIGGQTRNRLAAIDASTGAVTSWNPGANNGVECIAVGSGVVYAGGFFTAVGGQTRNRLCAIDAGTGVVTGWNPDASNTVFSMSLSGNTLYVGGIFSTMGGLGGSTRNALAAFDATSGAILAWNPNANNSVEELVVSGGVVYAGGQFTTIGGASRSHLAAIDGTTGVATGWAPNVSHAVRSIAVDAGTVYVGGDFTVVSGQSRLRLAAIDALTGAVGGWNPRGNDIVRAIAVIGSQVVAGGNFSSIGCEIRNYIAALGPSGTLLPWNPNANSSVLSLIVRGGLVYAGGIFTNIGGQARNRLAALNVNGVATPWNPNADDLVNALAVTQLTAAPFTTTFYAAGRFTSIAGAPRQRLAAIDGSTGAANGWNPSADNEVKTLTLAVDLATGAASTIYAGGDFTVVGGVPRNRLAAVDGAGATTAWNPNAAATVYALALSADQSKVYAGGSFTSIGGLTRNRIAAIDASTGSVTSWNPNASNTVFALAMDPYGVLAAGGFSAIGGQPRNLVAVLDEATGMATNWQPNPVGIYPRNLVLSSVMSVLRAGSTVYLGGTFSQVSGFSRTNLAAVGAAISAVAYQPNGLVPGGMHGVPNPFSSTVELHFDLDQGSRATVEVHDLSGRLVRRFWHHAATAGAQRVQWNGVDESGRTVRAGFYFARVKTEGRTLSARLLRLR